MRLNSPSTEQEDAAAIAAAVEDFLSANPASVLIESGNTLFDLREAKYKLSETQGRVVLHLWSEDRNMVRRVLSATVRGSVLRLTTQRFGQSTPGRLELVAGPGKRQPLGRDRVRQRFVATLERVLRREFPELTTDSMRSTMDLEHSFGPAYARGMQTQGQTAWAVIAVNAEETPVTIDGILTPGLLWLARCREQTGGRRLVTGLRLILPQGSAALTLSRLAWLDTRVARYELYEMDAETERLQRLDPADRGNQTTRLVRAPNDAAALGPDGRFAEAIPRVLALLPTPAPAHQERSEPASAPRTYRWTEADDLGVEMRLRSGAELAFLRHGMEFARIRSGYGSGGFNRSLEITVGSGTHETVLTETNADAMRALVHDLFRRRTAVPATVSAGSPLDDPLFRLQSERWLEGLLRADLPALDPSLLPDPVYVQVPAIAGAADRGMLDLLAVTRDHQLAVIEVKADEDLQLAMQGLDYWIRVRDHHTGSLDPATGLGGLQQQGYFPDTRLSAELPLLLLVAPALRIHPATETILRHLDPRVPWRLVALDERWRQRIRPIWRRRSTAGGGHAP